MHRLIVRLGSFTALVALLGVGANAGCGGKKPAEDATNAADGGDEGGGGGGDESASGGDGGAPGEKKDECVGFDIGNIEDILMKNSCEEPDVKPDSMAGSSRLFPVQAKARARCQRCWGTRDAPSCCSISLCP